MMRSPLLLYRFGMPVRTIPICKALLFMGSMAFGGKWPEDSDQKELDENALPAQSIFDWPAPIGATKCWRAEMLAWDNAGV